jgi:ubiquinone biosynthesis protein Coq4
MFAEPGMAERIVASWAAGTQATLDLVKDWDYWDDMDRPIAEVRSRLNIVPAPPAS